VNLKNCLNYAAMYATIATVGTSLCFAQTPPAATPPAATNADGIPTVTEDGIIKGSMDIDFKTRTNLDTSGKLLPDSAAIGAQDLYKFELAVAKTTVFSGEITRQPTLYSATLRRVQQAAQLGFNINLSVLNPNDLKQKKQVGKWVGAVPINPETGAYDLSGGGDRPLRVVVDAVGSAKAFEDKFSGKLVGKAEKKEGLASFTYKRLVGNKTVSFTVKKSDPMRFERLVLAQGPATVYPRTTVNGRLDYDYETGNWITDGIRFAYTLNGKEYTDVITGTIKWVEDPQRATNGKGQYEFNLRFNEDKNKPAQSETAAFDKMSEEDAFFVVDNTIPCLTGTIEYVDTLSGSIEAPTASKVTYNLNANKLTKQQIMNFFKLWTIGVGPTNDE